MPCEKHFLSVTEREAFSYPSTFFSSLYPSTHYEIPCILTDIIMKNAVFGDVISFHVAGRYIPFWSEPEPPPLG